MVFKAFRLRDIIHFAISVAIPLLVGSVSSAITRSSMEEYGLLNKPSFAPPPWLFPVVWTVLFVLMGIASYFVYKSDSEKRKNALWLYGVQLAVNFFWPVIFFNLGRLTLAFWWVLLLLVLVIMTTVSFYKIRKWSGILMIPYILWLVFAAFLNYMLILMN